MAKNYKKITFTGDIMCEYPIIKSSYKNNKFDFSYLFKNIKSFLSKSDFIIGNLETPVNNNSKGSKDIFLFDSPSELIDALKSCGFTHLNVSNNHMLDCGYRGLLNTIKIIKKSGLCVVGTKINQDMISYIKLNGKLTISLVSFSYGTNYNVNYNRIPSKGLNNFLFLDNPNSKRVELLVVIKNKMKRVLKKTIMFNFYKKINRSRNREIIPNIIIDNKEEFNYEYSYINKIKHYLKLAKKNSQFTILLGHCGGQFNVEVGDYTKKVVSYFCDNDMDFYVGMHPHVVQKSQIIDNKYLFYSLGNLLIYPNSPYLVLNTLPEYGILLHLYINEKDNKDFYFSFSIIKNCLIDNKVSIYLIDDLYKILNDFDKNKLKNDVIEVYNRFLNLNVKDLDINREYFL